MDICPYSKKPCGKQKVLHVTEIEKDGQVIQLDLCQECAAKYKNEPSPQSGVGGLLGALSLILLGSVACMASKRQVEKQTSKCPGCGTTPDDVIRTGKFGCCQCYDYYNASIGQVLEKCQDGAQEHVGKVPKKFPEEEEKRRLEKEAAKNINAQILNLESKMANAINVENYEVAQVLKLKIAELRQKLASDAA